MKLLEILLAIVVTTTATTKTIGLARAAAVDDVGDVVVEDGTSSPADRNLAATLAEKWNITNPTFDYNSLSFDLDYGVSDWITQGMVSYGIYDENCKEGEYSLMNSNVLTSSLSTISNTRGDGTGTRVQELTVSVNPATITSDTNIYEEAVIGGQQFAIVTFCIRLNLSTGGDSPIEVNFLETLVTLNVDLTDGFEIGTVAVAPKEKLVKTANQAYEVEGYLCDRSYDELNDAGKQTTRNQGAVIRVCVRPTLEGRNDGIYMREIQSFEFTRTYPDSRPDVRQIAIENSAAASNGLTDLFCERGWEVCMFESILFAAFYRDSGSVDGSGIASMQFGGSTTARKRQRTLRAASGTGTGGSNTDIIDENGRDLQQQDDADAVAEFEIQFVTLATLDGLTSGVGANALVGGSLVWTTMSAVLVAVPTLLM